MKVLNIMLGRKLGGIEQAFLDYSIALKSEAVNVTNITSVFAKVNSRCRGTISLPNLGIWDFLSVLYLLFLIIFIKPDLIIAHGNRAMGFARKAARACPVLGVAHNYNMKDLLQCDYIIALTEHMREYLIDKKFDESCIAVIPNMVNLRKERTTRHYHDPIVIGAMSRFVEKKGIDILLQSVAQLTAQHYDVRVIIAGNGEEKDNLIRLVKDLQLEQCVSFVGWVKDKEKFFNEIDIFCLPSLHEPFGIILLEAMANTVPIIATSVEGPSEIMRSRQDGLLCIPGSVSELATKIAYMLINPLDAKKYAESAYNRLKAKYTISVVAPQLSNFIKSIIASGRR